MNLSIPNNTNLVIHRQEKQSIEALYKLVYPEGREMRKPTFSVFYELIIRSDIVFTLHGIMFRMTFTDRTFPYIHAIVYSHEALRHTADIEKFLREIIYKNKYCGLQAIVPEDQKTWRKMIERVGFKALDIIIDYFLYGQDLINGVRYILS